MSPYNSYQKQLDAGAIKPDELQAHVIKAFEELYHELNKPIKKRWFFKVKKSFYGLYIFGKVGRGKTFLMDLFVKSLDGKKVKRQHFHAFMQWIHKSLHRIKNQQNPIDIIIKDLSENINILCLDEFLVHDITDAMLLSNILYALEKFGISLVTTSNVAPVDLYYGGLQRKKFMPAIDWMQKNMKIMQLDGDYDHRKEKNNNTNNWLSPINTSTKTLFEQRFSEIIKTQNIHLSPVTINKRPIAIIKRTEKHIMFEFDVLCKQARSASDYLLICQQYDSVFLVINQAIEANDRNTAKRFITLIDVLYDCETTLVVLSQVPFVELYSGTDFAFEMQRTLSRLSEM